MIWDKEWARDPAGPEHSAMKENHDRFLSHLKDSTDAVWRVAQWLCAQGYQASVMPATVAKTRKDASEHADHGDILLSQRIEVKRLGVDFTCATDWPYKGKFIVCAQHAWDRASPKPHAYIILSTTMEHAAIVKGDTSDKWYVEARKDSRYQGVEQQFYLCPLDEVVFRRLS